MPRALAVIALLVHAPFQGAAQGWHRGSDDPLVQRAVAVRAARDADALLAGWQAVATGVVRFAVVMHHGADSVERVMRADQLRVEVYGEAPNRSKQQIVAWRDTSFAPNRIIYHRDHLGIVAHDFGPIIRLGQGDEVRDVPHPLSPAGLEHYEYRVGDTVAVRGAEGQVRVVAVFVRPRDDKAPGTIGTLFLDVERAALVRFLFGFTAPSYRDRTVAAISVTLENALLDGRHWLPWRQAITIRREGPTLALPMHTILRADWRIGDYRLGVVHPPGRFGGTLVAGLRAPGGADWETPLDQALVGLPATERDLEAIVAHADLLAPGARLDGMPSLRFLGDRGLGSLLHVNRVEGITPGAGVRLVLTDRVRLDLGAAFGTAASRFTGTASVTWRLWRPAVVTLTVGRQVADVAAGRFGSSAMNSITTAMTGDDAGSWLLRDLFSEVEIRGEGTALRWRLVGIEEQVSSLSTRFTALDGTRRANPALAAGRVRRTVVSVGTQGFGEVAGWELTAEHGKGEEHWGRIAGRAAGRLAPFDWRLEAGAATGHLPAYRSFVAGGRGSLVGVPNRAIGGRRLARAELALPIAVGVPAPAGGRIASSVLASRVTPFVALAMAGGELPEMPWRATGDPETVLGVRVDLWGPLLRLEAGWALRRGTVGVSFDAHPDWWPLL